MSQTETDTPASSRSLYLALSIGGSVLVLALLAWLVLQPIPKRFLKPGSADNIEDPLVQARQALARDTDINTCRTALQQINQHLGQKPEARTSIPPSPIDELRSLFGLDDTAISELRNTSFTMLDGQHLDQCFLLRDAALSFQVAGLPVQPSPVEQATTAFAWTMRQVRLVEHDPPVVPPSFVLRRGWGSALERGLVFLALLQQVAPASELQGCLVYCPEKKDGPRRLWACGVVAGGSDVYLFDPRLGLPLPGPGGKGVATLTAVAKDPTLLTQLPATKTASYDVTADLASAAQLHQVCSLSALSGRMHYLQNKLLAPSIHVQLAVNALEERDRLEKAAGKGRVQVWQEPTREGPALNGPELLRRFLPQEEGGLDLNNRFQEFVASLVPLREMPAMFRDEQRFPRSVGLAQRIHMTFALPFVNSVTDPQKPRNLILRGRFIKAAKELVTEKGQIHDVVQQRLAQPNLVERTNEWSKAMFALYADLQRARGNPVEQEKIKRQIDEMWGPGNSAALALLLHAATAPARGAEVKYLLGQCKHNQAEQLQTRLDVEARAKLPISDTDRRERNKAWEVALDNWKGYLEEYPEHAGSPMARQLRARALAMLGQGEEAAAEWENLPVQGLEKVAALYMAQQLRDSKKN